MSLSDRLREIVGGRGSAVPVVRPPDGVASRPAARARDAAIAEAAAVLGGRLEPSSAGVCLVVDRQYSREARHGRMAVGDIVDALLDAEAPLDLLGRAWPSATGLTRTLCLLDLETTGLAGGAGTQAFLVGCAMVGPDGIDVRQFVMPGLEHERAQLDALTRWIGGVNRDRASGPAEAAAGGEGGDREGGELSVVTFNGRTFDVPLVETRYLYHRLTSPLDGRPHLDMLHPARRLWRDPSPGVTCALTTLERHLAGVHRVGDVPGFEIPARYFQFVRDGDARPLEAVLEHNRLDLLSTALLMARALGLLRRGPAAAASARECLGLGRVYEHAGAADEAAACYREAAALAAKTGRQGEVQAEALRRLADCARRGGRRDEAVAAWEALLDVRGGPAALRLEAREALAIHHEHRSRDLAEARRVVLEALNDEPDRRRRDAVEYRLRRLERKMAGRSPGRLMAALDDEA